MLPKFEPDPISNSSLTSFLLPCCHFPRGTHAYPACRAARILLHPDNHTVPSVRYTFVNAISPSFSPTLTVSPGAYLPARISFASGFSICCWIARFSGRAP
jgi:hypothetical protein